MTHNFRESDARPQAAKGDALGDFLPPVATWFRAALGEPTPVQAQGWPIIRSGADCLLLAPTGSGKTLAAFMACLDELWRQPELPQAVKVLYISPLKALNNDIHRNLQVPLAGVAAAAREMDFPLPRIEAAVRTGDTSNAERQRLLRKPPQVLITTPESLHLLLTSRGRETLTQLRQVIVDEIHALCPNKRGVFLSLLLERLEAINPEGFSRIGLSATQRPLDEVARFLAGDSGRSPLTPHASPLIVDAGLRKNLDLEVISPVDQFGPLPEKSVWPSIYRLLAEQIRSHRSTIVFANNRRSVERITSQLNEIFEGEDEPPVRAHHGSVALEVRQATEQALKDGALKAVVATGSLELGIDMGQVDLVCQLESPGSVSRGLQRVGRAGHLVGSQSKGRLIPKTLSDLVDQAVLAAEMSAGRVEELRVPMNCLDVLAQQIIAMVAVEDWDVPELFNLVRRAYPYHALTAHAFDTVLEMITGRFAFTMPTLRDEPANSAGISPVIDPARQMSAFQPRISWDRVHNRLQALPGSQRLALVQGGTIPDTGQYAVYTGKGIRLGELDEEFVYERRVGDVFLLGTNSWRINAIETDRVLVDPAEGQSAMPPFWRGERTGRTFDLGLAQGRFLRTLTVRLDDPACLDWLQSEHHLDSRSARNVRDYVRRQHQRGGVPTDVTAILEASRDPLGDWQLLLMTPLGNRFHFTLRLALENRLHQRLGYRPRSMHHDDGVLLHLSDTQEPILDVLDGITAETVQELVLDGLADSALFALRFRQNAARALLLPRPGAGKRAPLWLQRLRGRDLLQMARRHADFPILVETFRECLHDHLDLDNVRQWLADTAAGKVEVRERRAETPSPFAASILFTFHQGYMYQYDQVDLEPGQVYAGLDQHLLEQLVPGKTAPLDARAVETVESRLRGVGQPPRTPAETAEWLRRLGDVTAHEAAGPVAGFLHELCERGTVKRIELTQVREPFRWILAEEAERYEQVFQLQGQPALGADEVASRILYRFLQTHALVGLTDVLERYPFEPGWARRKLEEWARSGRLVTVNRPEAPEPVQWSAPDNFQSMQRGTLALRRREILACPAWQFVDFLLDWQHVAPESRLKGTEGLDEVLQQLEALPMPADLCERTIFPARLRAYQPGWLDQATASGRWTWWLPPVEDGLAFVERDHIENLPSPGWEEPPTAVMQRAFELLQGRGALFLSDLAHALQSPSSDVRRALRALMQRGFVSNDSFEVVRRREWAATTTPDGLTRTPRPSRPGLRRAGLVEEGRWFVVPWIQPEREVQALFQVRLLLKRYGVVARELAALDPTLPPWRLLYEVLARLELAGEVRRGYFVEGLSGAQFALPDALDQLQQHARPAHTGAPALLLNSVDPANLFGARAPFDLDIEESRPFVRRAGNWLVVRAGRPVLLVEQQGKRLTTIASAGTEDVSRAVACLPALLDLQPLGDFRRKLVVEEWNGQPVTSTPGKELLAQAGFVRDYQAMTLYGVWR